MGNAMKLIHLTANYRSGITNEEVEDAIFEGTEFELAPSDRGNDRLMYVGWTQAGRLIEVGVEFRSKTEWLVFHAMNATKQYVKRLKP